MNKEFNVYILSPEKIIYEGKACSVVLPAFLGYLEVLKDHAPLMGKLQKGRIKITKSDKTQQLIQLEKEGFFEVVNNSLNLLLS
ncbi:MAG: hypothetical protein MUF05_00820 [Candidatus Omnitrophica bacterium]|jgi:F0F1-type ATP synthase epsilon subunit|nr:hypothetical protein [Candidatus Omnitrophota bacterium]